MSKIFKEFGGCKSDISQNYCAEGRFFTYTLNYGYLATFRKTLEQPQVCMRCTFTCHKMCAR